MLVLREGTHRPKISIARRFAECLLNLVQKREQLGENPPPFANSRNLSREVSKETNSLHCRNCSQLAPNVDKARHCGDCLDIRERPIFAKTP